MNFLKKLGDKEVLIIAGDVSGDAKNNAEDHVDQRRSYGYGVRNKEGKGFWSCVQL